MLAKLFILAALVACVSAFAPARFGSRMGGAVRMAEEPWFPNSVTSNTVSMGTLE